MRVNQNIRGWDTGILSAILNQIALTLILTLLSLFPLNGCRGLTADVVNDPVDSFYPVDDFVRNVG
jgi:hypothetical protein